MGVKKRRGLVRQAAQGMLEANPKLAGLADKAREGGITFEAVLDALGRALLFGIWYFEQEGGSEDPNATVAIRFRVELRKLGMTTEDILE